MDFKRLDTVKSCLLALAVAIALPAADAAAPATAQSGTGSTGGQPAPADGGAPSDGAAPNGSGGLSVPIGVLVHQVASVQGALGGSANVPVAIEQLDPGTGTWTAIATARTTAGGAFIARWRANHIGRYTLRAVRGGARAADATQQPQAPTGELTVYRPAVASWFGPGFYAQRTACGETMSTTLLGVAHRSLPCGTLVEISYGGRTVTVPVVDRGPYRHGVSWDLTTATAQALGLTETARVGALVLHTIVPPPASGGSSGTSTTTSGGQAAG